jgi:hypothetical protein
VLREDQDPNTAGEGQEALAQQLSVQQLTVNLVEPGDSDRLQDFVESRSVAQPMPSVTVNLVEPGDTERLEDFIQKRIVKFYFTELYLRSILFT